MRTTRIELEGDAGHLAIERKPADATIRIDSIIHNPVRGQQAWKSWELDAGTSPEELFRVAIELQFRTDGCTGTNSMIQDYYRELQRFQD